MTVTRLIAASAFVLSMSGIARAEGPPGAASCSGCHAATRASKRRCRRSKGGAGRHHRRDDRIQIRQTRRHHHGPHREGILRRGNPRDRRVVRGTEVGGRAMRTSRRQFLKASAAAALLPMPAIAQGAGPQRRRDRRRIRRRARRRARSSTRHAPITVTLVEPQSDVHRLPVLQRRDRRIARAEAATIHLRQGRAGRRRAGDSRPPRRSTRRRKASRSRTARRCPMTGSSWRPASSCASTACPVMTRARPTRCRTPGRRASRPCCCTRQIASMEDGGTVFIVGAGQSVPLSARPLRARQPDRALPENQKAEVEGHHPRRQGRVLQAAPVPERLEGALSRPSRMGVAVAGRQGERRQAPTR